MTKNVLAWLSAFTLLILGCGGLPLIAPATAKPAPIWTAPPSPSPIPLVTVTPILFPTYSPTVPPSPTPIPTLTPQPTLTPEPQWLIRGPGDLIVPILLYHHIGFSLQGDTVYYVSPEAFDQQMNLLYQWGYKTISVELLARAIKEGAQLPPKPVILTFDDGSETTYTAALPILQRYGFAGVSYVVLNYIGIPRYMTAEQIRGLYAAGWEIGSHGLSHIDLTSSPRKQEAEVSESRKRLEKLLGLPVTSFAYPFGLYDDGSLRYVHLAGYVAAMGLGKGSLQGQKDLFYLHRQPVTGTVDLEAFARLVPWREAGEDILPLTIVP